MSGNTVLLPAFLIFTWLSMAARVVMKDMKVSVEIEDRDYMS